MSPTLSRLAPARLTLLAALQIPALLLIYTGGRATPLGLGIALSLLLSTAVHVPRPHRLVQAAVSLVALTIALGLLTFSAGPARHNFGLYVTIGGLALALPQLWWPADRRGAALALGAGLVALMGLARAAERPQFALAVGLYLTLALLSTRLRDPHAPPLRDPGAHRPLALALTLALGTLAALGALLPRAEPTVTRALSPYLFGGAGTSGFGEGRIALGESGRINLDDAVKIRIDGPPTDHLRGRVYAEYRGGSWAVAATGAETVPHTPPDPLPLATTPPTDPRPLTFEGAADAGLALFAPLDAARLDRGPALTRRDAYGVLELPPEAVRDTRTWTLHLGDPRARLIAPPHPTDRDLPHRWTDHYTDLAARLTAAHQTPRARIAAIEAHLRPFTYTLDLPTTPPRVDPTWWFLTTTKAGHCEYFASALTLLARAAGHPARLVAGYRVIEHNPLGDYALVRARDAHAWVEIWYDGAWHTHDPTPPGALSEDTRRTLGPLAARWDLVKRAFARAFERLADLSALEVLAALTLIVLLLLLLRAIRARRARAAAPSDLDHWPPLLRLEAHLARRHPRPAHQTLERYADALTATDPDAAALIRAAAALRYGRIGDPDALADRIDRWLAAR